VKWRSCATPQLHADVTGELQEMPPKPVQVTANDDSVRDVYARPRLSPGGAFNPQHATRIVAEPNEPSDDLDDWYECQVFSSITTTDSDFHMFEGYFCGARTKTGDEMYQHYWRLHPELMNGGMEITDLVNGEEFQPVAGYRPLTEIEVEFCKRVLPEVYCGEAFDEAFNAALTWLESIENAAEEGTLDFESVVQEYVTKTLMQVNPPQSSHLESPVASAKVAAVLSSTPVTQPKPKPKPPAATAEAVPDFLKNKDLFGLEPALSVRTRILLACHAQSRMNMSLDIAKSFAIAGYFPRQRYACLPSAFFIMHLLYLQTSKAESISGRSGSSKWRAAARRKARFWSKT
jgi:hypothetical protein